MIDHSGIAFLKKQFLCCTPLNKFKWPDPSKINNEDIQKQIIDMTVKNPLVLEYPMKQSYKIAFLKSFINMLEKHESEIADYVYNSYCDNIASSDEQSPMHYRHFIFENKQMESLTVKESTNIISEGTTGLCSWKAAFYLAEWCISHEQDINGKNILELGSGVGLTGLTILNFCRPKTYYFSDCHPIVLRTLKENLDLNLCGKNESVQWEKISSEDITEFRKAGDGEKRTAKALHLRWEEMEKFEKENIELDLVIAADVLYDNSTFESLVCGLKRLICQHAKYAIVVATIRNETTVVEFLNLLEKYHLRYEEETTSAPEIFIQTEETPIRIIKISRQNC